MRQHPKEARYKSLVRLHDKKIGGFCVNPLSEYHIATASLDRSIKIWDLRGGKHSNTSDGLSSLHTCGEYNSRLSVSSVDWNSNQRLPQDSVQKFAIGNMRRSINIYSEDGAPIANLAAPDIMTAVPAVVTLHPSRNWVLGGTSSGRVFLFN
ncbi:hypothetical protein OXX80_012087 [Metschnikowia pulcherrima]